VSLPRFSEVFQTQQSPPPVTPRDAHYGFSPPHQTQVRFHSFLCLKKIQVILPSSDPDYALLTTVNSSTFVHLLIPATDQHVCGNNRFVDNFPAIAWNSSQCQLCQRPVTNDADSLFFNGQVFHQSCVLFYYRQSYTNGTPPVGVPKLETPPTTSTNIQQTNNKFEHFLIKFSSYSQNSNSQATFSGVQTQPAGYQIANYNVYPTPSLGKKLRCRSRFDVSSQVSLIPTRLRCQFEPCWSSLLHGRL
jgi:hypothetical protein